MQKNTRLVRSATFAAIVGLTMTMGATGAMAQDGAPGEAGSPIVNPTATGTLTIHKKADPENVGTPTGNVDEGVSGTDLVGAGFTIYRINGVDLTSNTGLAAAAGLNAADYLNADGSANTELVTQHGDQQVTGADGQIVYQELPLGAYLVVETAPVEGYDPAVPFIAFVPMTQDNATTGGVDWNYNVVAYPKNYKQGEAEKEVVDSGQNVGDEITYTVSATARSIAPNQERTLLRIEDTLDARLDPPAVGDVLVEGYEAGTDYTVTIDDQKVTITFTEAGLGKITNGEVISATIPATVNSAGDGAIKNEAIIFDNNPATGEDVVETPTPEVVTYYSGIQFKKVDIDRGALDGAVFQVYGATAADQACVDVVQDQANLQTVDGVSEWTSGDDGLVTINGLHVNEFTDNEEKPNEFVKYCLVETQSPQGYELLAQPIEFELLVADAGNLKSITVGEHEGEVVNLDDTTPNLPLTGGAGIGLIAALGALLVGAGAWWAKRNTAKA